MFEKQWGWVGVIALAALLLVSPPTDAADRDFSQANTVRMGIVSELQMSTGQGIVNAAKMAAEEINASGGILGKKIELFIGDSELKPEKGVMAMKKLVLDDKVDVLIGTMSSGVALAIQPFLSEYQIVFMTTGSASPDLPGNVLKDYGKNKYFFMNMANANRQVKATFQYAMDFVHPKLGAKKFAMLVENAKWSEPFADLKEALEKAGMEVVFYERFDTDLKDFSPTFAKIKSLKADYIFHVISHAAAIPLIKAWADSKPAPMGAINPDSGESQFWDITGGACLYEVSYNHLARAALSNKTIPFWDKYTKAYGSAPVYTSGYTYDAVYMMAEVIKKTKSLKTHDIIKGLETISFNGVLHPQLGFDQKSHDLLEGRTLLPFVQWQEGAKQVVIFPEKYKTGEFVKPAWWKK
jgi:branched-chain amino acid transport system substrate-binding protein